MVKQHASPRGVPALAPLEHERALLELELELRRAAEAHEHRRRVLRDIYRAAGVVGFLALVAYALHLGLLDRETVQSLVKIACGAILGGGAVHLLGRRTGHRG